MDKKFHQIEPGIFQIRYKAVPDFFLSFKIFISEVSGLTANTDKTDDYIIRLKQKLAFCNSIVTITTQKIFYWLHPQKYLYYDPVF